jgi:prepilin-type N-terminal cleavage/methylation domain-containing protein
VIRPKRAYGLQRGDTIIEVLICVLIISMILAGAYTTVQRSAVGIRNSQEHAEVLKLLQSQVEQLRNNSASTTSTIFTVNLPFCMADGVAVSTTLQPGAAKCDQDSGGKPNTTEPIYHMSIKRATSTGGGVLFSVRADWASVTNTPAQTTIFYRLQR